MSYSLKTVNYHELIHNIVHKEGEEEIEKNGEVPSQTEN